MLPGALPAGQPGNSGESAHDAAALEGFDDAEAGLEYTPEELQKQREKNRHDFSVQKLLCCIRGNCREKGARAKELHGIAAFDLCLVHFLGRNATKMGEFEEATFVS